MFSKKKKVYKQPPVKQYSGPVPDNTSRQFRRAQERATAKRERARYSKKTRTERVTNKPRKDAKPAKHFPGIPSKKPLWRL